MRAVLNLAVNIRSAKRLAPFFSFSLPFSLLLSLLLIALAACGPRDDIATGPCQSDSACQGSRICHEGRCRFEEEVRRELALGETLEPDENGVIDLSEDDEAALDPEHPDFVESALFTPSEDRKSTRLNSSHVRISYAVFCLK